MHCHELLSLGLAVCLVGCSQRPPLSAMRFSGTLEMTEHSVGMPVPGRLVEVLVEEEQPVRQGQVIARLERFALAERDFERAAALVGSGGVSQQDYEHEKQDMEDRMVISPVDGVVLIKVRETGEVVPAGAPIVVIGERKDMWVKVFIPEDLVSQLAVQQRATIQVDGLEREISGHISYIASKAEFTPRNIQTPEERATQTFAVKVVLDDPQLSLHPGVTADVYFN